MTPFDADFHSEMDRALVGFRRMLHKSLVFYATVATARGYKPEGYKTRGNRLGCLDKRSHCSIRIAPGIVIDQDSLSLGLEMATN